MANPEESAKRRYVSAYYFAIIYLGLNDRDQVFEWSERAFEERAGLLAFIKVEPMVDAVREEPRLDLLTRMGLQIEV